MAKTATKPTKKAAKTIHLAYNITKSCTMTKKCSKIIEKIEKIKNPDFGP